MRATTARASDSTVPTRSRFDAGRWGAWAASGSAEFPEPPSDLIGMASWPARRQTRRYNGQEARGLPPLHGMTQPIAAGGTVSARPGSALY